MIAENGVAAFAKGADVGWLSQLEDRGVTWYNDNGVQQDALQILKDHGIDSIRLRVFVNPSTSFQWTKPDGVTCLLGYCDKTGIVSMAKRCAAMGFRIMIDFHYSDVFADPAYQIKPLAWAGYNFGQLETEVYNHTYYILSVLKANGIFPEWVQVGNEINPGLLLPDGSTANFDQLAQLINSGYDAVKAVHNATKVIIHLAGGADHNNFRSWFDNLKNCGGKWDVIGMSYYPYWDGVDFTQNISALAVNMNDLAALYGKEVMVVEVGGRETDPRNTYDYLVAVLNAVKAVPNGKGIGVFYWEPEVNSMVLPDQYPLGACLSLGNNRLKFSKALDAFLGTDTHSFYAKNQLNTGSKQ